MSKSPVIGLIEFLSDSGAEPVVYVGDSVEQVRAEVARYLSSFIVNIEYIDEEWIEENPTPDFDDAAAVAAWMEALRDATTDAWLTIYEATRSDGRGTDQYRDLRA